MIRITANKNLPLLIHRGENEIDHAAAQVRLRFATADKHQIYADKRDEAKRFVQEMESGQEPDGADYPYLSAEIGTTAATMIDLAYMWLFMDGSWKKVSALIEEISIDAKIRVRNAGSAQEISMIVAETKAVLDAVGAPPPIPPKTHQQIISEFIRTS